jgi:hypothetical protein
MNRLRIEDAPTHAEIDWTPFPGGELEGQRPKALCPACRAKRGGAKASPAVGRPALCFQCYRLELERNGRIRAAGELNTASDVRFQENLPFEPVNVSRLVQLKTEREQARTLARVGSGDYAERRRRAQIAARHALARILKGLKQREPGNVKDASLRRSVIENVTHAAELQLPESWLPFVVAQ